MARSATNHRTRTPSAPGIGDGGDPAVALPPGRDVELPGRGTTFVRELAGPPGAPTLMLVHGLTASADLNWGPSYAALARQFRVVALDLRGHGRGVPASMPFRLETCADDVAALVRLRPGGPLRGGAHGRPRCATGSARRIGRLPPLALAPVRPPRRTRVGPDQRRRRAMEMPPTASAHDWQSVRADGRTLTACRSHNAWWHRSQTSTAGA